jgi:hypothetical protein
MVKSRGEAILSFVTRAVFANCGKQLLLYLQIPPWSIMSILRDGAKGCHKMGGQSLMM